MRVAVISDIHGNGVALDAVLADIRSDGPDQIVCLGDVVQGGPQPGESVDRIKELGCPIVMGNTDSWLASGLDPSVEDAPENVREVGQWSVEQLSSSRVDFIKEFKPTVEVSLDETRKLLCFHGSPKSFHDVILPETEEEEFQEFVGGFESAVLTGGHTHLQQIRRIGDSFFFNPGSVGVVYNRNSDPASFHFDGWGEYVMLTSDGRGSPRLEFRRAEFDVGKLVQAALSSGMPNASGWAARYKT
jgi:putative phosphoesterase